MTISARQQPMSHRTRRDRSRLTRPALPLLFVLMLLLTMACGGGGDDDAGADSDGGSGDSATGVSAGEGGSPDDVAQQIFTASGCAECHGAEGEGVDGTPGSELSGTRLIIQQFQTRVRNGRGSTMPGFTAEQISDDDIMTIYEWLRSQ